MGPNQQQAPQVPQATPATEGFFYAQPQRPGMPSSTAGNIAQLGGIALNLAGLLTGRGAVGQGAMNAGQQIYDQQYVDDMRAFQAKKEQDELKQAQDQATKLRPEIERLPQGAVRDALVEELKQGKPDKPLSYLISEHSRKKSERRTAMTEFFKGLTLERQGLDNELKGIKGEIDTIKAGISPQERNVLSVADELIPHLEPKDLENVRAFKMKVDSLKGKGGLTGNFGDKDIKALHRSMKSAFETGWIFSDYQTTPEKKDTVRRAYVESNLGTTRPNELKAANDKLKAFLEKKRAAEERVSALGQEHQEIGRQLRAEFGIKEGKVVRQRAPAAPSAAPASKPAAPPARGAAPTPRAPKSASGPKSPLGSRGREVQMVTPDGKQITAFENDVRALEKGGFRRVVDNESAKRRARIEELRKKLNK
jgi:hypothetical protein